MRCRVFGLLVAGLAVPAAAGAQTTMTLLPSVAVSAVSDDNVFSTAAPTSDQMVLVSPAVQGRLETPRSALLAGYSIDMQRSADFSSLDNVEARRHGMFDGTYRQTPRLTVSLGGHYDRTDDASELNFATGVLLPRTPATRWDLVPSVTYRTSPVVTVQGQYAWVRESLERAVTTTEHAGRVFVSRQLSTRASVSAGYIARGFVNGDAAETSHAAVAGATYAIGPFTTVTVQGGPRHSSARGFEPEFSASLKGRGPRAIAYAADGWRGESIVLGVVGPVEVTSVTARMSMPLRHHVGVGAAGGVFDSDSLFQGRTRVYHAEGIASWSLRPRSTIAASYGVDHQHGDIRTFLLNDRDIVRHVFLLQFTISARVSRTNQPVGPIQAIGRRTQGSQP